MGTMIEFSTPDGTVARGYLAMVGQDKPGMIVIQEWWGLNEDICAVADRLSGEGFNVLAPDLYEGRVTQDPDEAEHLMHGLDFEAATHQEIHGAVQYLGSRSGRVGVMGFCLGGALTVSAAVHVPGLGTAVCFYGVPPKHIADPGKIRIPFQGHFADRDDWCTPQAVNALESAMHAAGQSPEIYRYDANHGFYNQASEKNYDAESAEAAWERTVAFLRRHLG